MKVSVSIYSDRGVSELGIASLEMVFKDNTRFYVEKVTADDILNGVLDKTDIFIIPGGADLPYCERLNGEGNEKIRRFVQRGGIYIGICAGAYYACRRINFKGKDYSVTGDRELGFFEGTAEGSLPFLTGGNYYRDNGTDSKAMVMLKFKDKISGEYFYYHGGPVFIPDSITDNKYKVVAKYTDNTPAIVKGRLGKGSYLLSGVHFEIQEETYRRYVLEKSEGKDRRKEEAICNHFGKNYGSRVWKEVFPTFRKKWKSNVKEALNE